MAGQIPPCLRRSTRLQQKEQTWSDLNDAKFEYRGIVPPSEYEEFSKESTHLRHRARTRLEDSKYKGEDKNPIKHWVATGSWPASFKAIEDPQAHSKTTWQPSEMATPEMIETPDLGLAGETGSQISDDTFTRGHKDSPKKRRRGKSSDASGRDTSRDSSPAHGQVTQLNMEKHGIYLLDTLRQTPLPDSQKSCGEMLKKHHEYSPPPVFVGENYRKLLIRLYSRNEARVFRDLTPMLVPSVETLSILHEGRYEYIAEELSTMWSKVQTMGNSAPKPDITVGVAESAFSEEELAKIHNYSTYLRPARFTPILFYPFFICEAKSNEVTITKAERQSAHGAAIAVRAIIELHRTLGDTHGQALSGKILAFTLVHVPDVARIYGHYATVDALGSTTRYHRYLVQEVNLIESGESGAKMVHSFIMELYEAFFQEHLQRIRDVLSQMESPKTLQPDHINQTAQDDGTFLEPAPSVTQILKQELEQAQKKAEQAQKKQEEQINLLRQQLEDQRLDSIAITRQMQESHNKQRQEDQKRYDEQQKLYYEQRQEDQRRYDEQQKMLQDLIRARS